MEQATINDRLTELDRLIIPITKDLKKFSDSLEKTKNNN